MKKIIVSLGFLLLFINLSAQKVSDGKREECDYYLKRPYVFEGKVDSFKYFTIQTGQYTYENYNVYLVEVIRVIKGNLHKGTIEIFQPADGIIEKGPNGTRSTQHDDGNPPPINEGVFACWDKSVYMRKSCYATSNGKALWYNSGIAATNGIIKKESGGGISAYFNTLSDFYNYISANYGIKIEDK